MKLTVKTLKGTHFEIRVHPIDTIMAVKKNIEEVQGKDNYPWGQQLLIHNGKVLKDESTLEENKVSEDGFLVVMLSKSKTSSTGGSSSAQPSTTAVAPPPAPTQPAPQAQSPSNPAPVSERRTPEAPADAYGQAASNLVAGSNLDQIVNQLMDMGGGNWDKDTVLRALRAAYNNPERAVEYLYSGIPPAAEVAVPVAPNADEATTTGSSPLFGLPNSSPLNMFPQGAPSLGAGAGAGSLEFLRNNPQVKHNWELPFGYEIAIRMTDGVQVNYPIELAAVVRMGKSRFWLEAELPMFQALRAMVQANPQILQPMLQELSKQNPQLLRMIQEHHAEFLQLINEPVEGVEGDLFDQPEQEMPHAINVTPVEQEAIARLEAMGFDRAQVIEAFLACDRNEELAANYLLEHAGDED